MADSGGYKAGSLSLNISANTTTATKNIAKLSAQLVTLSNVLKGINGSSVLGLNSLINGMSGKGGRVGGSTGGTGGTGGGKSSASLFWGKQGVKSNSLAKFLNIGYLLSKLRLTWMMAQKIANVGKQMVQYGIDYTETLNLWQVAMRDNVNLATKFVSEMSRGYGISEKTLMNTQAIYKNMIGALGNVSSATTYQLSEALVKMTLDFSSLYNVTFEDAEKKMQAVLARQVRPIRSVSGYDITERTIYDLYQQMGGTKMMRQLNNTEKQLLSIYAVFKQMQTTGALGDYQKTINETANQSRMMAQNWEQLMTYLGLSLKLLLDQSELLIKINAGLIVASEYARNFAIALGYEKPDFLSGLFDNLFEDTEKVNDEIDELQGKLLGFDKFRVLGEQASDGGDISIDETLLQALVGYQSSFNELSNKARQLANEWLTALGFQQELIYQNKEGVKITTDEYSALNEEEQKGYVGITEWTKGLSDAVGKFNLIKDNLGGIIGLISILTLKSHPFVSTITLIGTALAQDKEFLDMAVDVFKEINAITFPFFEEILNITKQILPIIVNFINALLPTIKSVVNALLKASPSLVATVVKIFNSLLQIITMLSPFMDIILLAVADWMPLLASIISDIAQFIVDIVAIAMPMLDVFLKPVLDFVTMILKMTKELVNILLPPITLFLESLSYYLTPVLELIGKILQTITLVGDAILNLDFSSLGSDLGSLWKNWDLGKLGGAIKGEFSIGSEWAGFLGDRISNDDKMTLQYSKQGTGVGTEMGMGERIGRSLFSTLETEIAKGINLATQTMQRKKEDIIVEVNLEAENLLTAIRRVANKQALDLAPISFNK